MLKNSNILITGGTGSFGRTFVPLTIKKYSPKKIVIYSRDEMKQYEMQKLYKNDPRVKFMIGDVRDIERLNWCLDGIDSVVHAAATKIVPTAEYNPIECIKTNVNGAINVVNASIRNKVKKVVALSTDKASNPINLYGASKLCSDKIFISSNLYHSKTTTTAVVRYGNVLGSRGSVIPFFLEKSKTGEFPITDKEMTRFMITLEEGVDLVWKAFDEMIGGETFVKKIPSMNICDIAKAINPEAKLKIIGIRPGEKIHEQMIGYEDADFTYEYDNYYKILPMLDNWCVDKNRIKNGIKVKKGFRYTSNENNAWMTIEQLQNWLRNFKK
ncbi:MAG: UDP-N-acetylglucosamine 4,6-dehydratase (inverting) [Prochlorococcus marinus XMU1425]|nr:UDP-N-acetylglucosamine 4,6-dehydratase (inverting) [Prochlorococcus marinus XMU1425]MCR8534172.1 UDP-N-acetylglucosamine 4,6-dehydratase (inverting) [Prochlorococcus marinus XMU1426]